MSHYHLWTESTDQLSTDNILNTIIFHSSRLLQYVGAVMSLCGCACSITIEWMRPNPNNTFFYKFLNSWRLVIEAFDAQVMVVLTFWLLLELKYKYMMCQYWTYELIHLWTCDQDHAADPLLSPQRWVGAELLLANSRSRLMTQSGVYVSLSSPPCRAPWLASERSPTLVGSFRTKIKLSVSLEEGTAITDRKQSLYSVEQWLFIVPRTGHWTPIPF